MQLTMLIPKLILKLGNRQKTFTTNDILEELKGKYTRAYILRFINNLIKEGKLVKSGSTRSAQYALKAKSQFLHTSFSKRYVNRDLREHEVLEELYRKCPFFRKLPEHIHSIFSYAFSEMLNNAIEHSQSKNIQVEVGKEGALIKFTINDFGIGVYRNIMKKRNLASPLEAIQDLLKGKTTTMPHAHSGEGIFFTSKVADQFTLESFGSSMLVDNLIDDVFVSGQKYSKRGTKVTFEINQAHEAHLDDVFKEFYSDPEDLAFDKTEIRVKLYIGGSVYVSRSQAKRILSGLEKFRTIILDFDQVPGVGQAFVDEIFRVFQSKYPEIQIIPENMTEAVRFMVERVEKP